MVKLKSSELARLVDISAVRTESSLTEVENIIQAAREYRFICVFAMPSMLPYVSQGLSETDDVGIGGVVGFPSGGESTDSKVWQAAELKNKGCDEIDMVMNIGKLKSGLYEEVIMDIKSVKEVVHPLPLKVIIEVSLLSDAEIVKASEIVMESGADFIKTGTGWAGVTSMRHVKLIKDTVGNRIKLKVAGGVRSLETLEAMYNAGVTRFG